MSALTLVVMRGGGVGALHGCVGATNATVPLAVIHSTILMFLRVPDNLVRLCMK